MRTVAVLPVKRFGQAKSRLAGAYEPEPRAELAGAMVRDVIAALAGSRLLHAVIVVTGDPDAAALAQVRGFHVLAEDSLAGHSAAATLGVRHALEMDAERVLLVPGDCPALTGADLDALLERHDDPGVVVVPDRHGTGTNALLLTPPTAIAPAFGEGSCLRHQQLAASAGAACAIDAVDALALDVDNAEDLEAVRASGATGAETIAVLDRLSARA